MRIAVATIGMLVAVLWAVAAAWRTAAAAGGRWIMPMLAVSGVGRWRATNWFVDQLGRHGLLTALLIIALWVAMHAPTGADVLVGILGATWLLAAVVSGLAVIAMEAWRRRGDGSHSPRSSLIDDRQLLPTGAAVTDVVVPTWTFVCLLEMVFHFASGGFLPMRAVSALLRAMSNEVVAMLFGPESPRLAAFVAIFLAVAAVWTVVRRRRRRRGEVMRRHATVCAVLVVAGIGAVWTAPPRVQRMAMHHMHPSIDDFFQLLGPSLRETLARDDSAGERALHKLWPKLAAEPIPLAATTRESRTQPSVALPAAQHVVLIFIDSLSRRRLPPWGYSRPNAPNITDLAATATRFDRAESVAAQTDLATTALFYSLVPFLNLDKSRAYREGHGGVPVHLLLRNLGFEVGMFSADWEAHDAGHGPLFPERCSTFIDARGPFPPALQAEVDRWAGVPEHHLVDRLLQWAPGVDREGKRFFAYFKALRPHEPYHSPTEAGAWRPPFQPAASSYGIFDFHPSPSRRALLLNRADNAIHYTDYQIGRLIEGLKAAGLWQKTAVILIADHGEAWGEHLLYGHGVQHYEEFLEVPLLVRIPGQEPAVDNRMASILDVGPTILDVLGLPDEALFEGRSLIDRSWSRRSRLSLSNNAGMLLSIEVDGLKAIWAPATDERWLFDRRNDPAEQHNLAWIPGWAEHEVGLIALMKHQMRRQLSHMERLRKLGLVIDGDSRGTIAALKGPQTP